MVHVCAVHGGSAPAAAVGVQAHHHHQSAPNEKGEHCTCLSQCSGTSPVAITVPSVAIESTTTEVQVAVFRAPTIVVAAIRPYARPFANGPPVA